VSIHSADRNKRAGSLQKQLQATTQDGLLQPLLSALSTVDMLYLRYINIQLILTLRKLYWN